MSRDDAIAWGIRIAITACIVVVIAMPLLGYGFLSIAVVLLTVCVVSGAIAFWLGHRAK